MNRICEDSEPSQNDLRDGWHQQAAGCLFSTAGPFRVSGGLCHFSVPPSSLRCKAGLEELDESCGNDVEDELAPELDDNPGKTIGTKCSVLQSMFFPSLVRCGV